MKSKKSEPAQEAETPAAEEQPQPAQEAETPAAAEQAKEFIVPEYGCSMEEISRRQRPGY
jgi:hypothetical protein